LTVTPPGSPAPFEVFKENYEFGVGGWMEPTFAGLGIRISIAQQKQKEYEGLRLAAGVGHLADCILEDRKPLISGERARHVLEIMLAVTESSRSGRAVELTTTV
jgi:predicted dehydrogenase